jgi:hypothetical protein
LLSYLVVVVDFVNSWRKDARDETRTAEEAKDISSQNYTNNNGVRKYDIPKVISTCAQRQSQLMSAEASLFGMTPIRIIAQTMVSIARERSPMSISFFFGCTLMFQRAATGIAITTKAISI